MASPNISFETIPSSIRVPGVYTEFNTKLAVRNLPVNPQKVIIIAQALAAGTHDLLKPVQVFSDGDAEQYFGAGSQAHLMVRQAIRNNPYISLSVIGLADAAAAIKATATLTFTGNATSQGVATAMISGIKYQTAVTTGATPADIATKLAAVINAEVDTPVVATNAAGVITLTAKHGGVCGNEISVTASTTAKAVYIATTAMSGGDVNPDVDDALSVIAGEHYQIIASPFSDVDNARKLREHIDYVSGSIEQRGAVGVMGHRGSMATGTTLTQQINSGRVVTAWLNKVSETNAMIAAGFAAVLAFEEDPAIPLNHLEIKGLTPPAAADTPTFAEYNTALYNGLAPLEIVNNRVQIMRAITTYTKNATGTDDPSLLDVTTIRTLDYTRMAINQRMALRFPREKLSEKTPPKVRSEILDVLTKMEELEFIEAVEANKNKLIVERDSQDVNRLNTAIPADVVNGLHVLANRIDLYL